MSFDLSVFHVLPKSSDQTTANQQHHHKTILLLPRPKKSIVNKSNSCWLKLWVWNSEMSGRIPYLNITVQLGLQRACINESPHLTTNNKKLNNYNWIILVKRKNLSGGFPGGSEGKESVYNAEDLGLIPGSGRSPGEENSYPFQCSCLPNTMDRGAWQTTVHRVSKSWTWLSD